MASHLLSTLDVRLVSLDVFDTLITRACGKPSDLHLWLGRRLASRIDLPVSPEVFARARVKAESVVWDREGGMDSHVNLVTIHSELVRTLGLSTTTAAELAKAEFDLEREMSRPVPGLESLLSSVDASDHIDIVVVSDTYLSGQQVRQLLNLNHTRVPDRQFVSSDVGASKASAMLFDAVLDETGQVAGTVVHCGDNPYADVDVPRTLGMRAAWTPAARLSRYEAELSDASWATGGLSAAFAGASRRTRLSVSVASDHQAAIRDVAAGVAAPVLVSYVMWVLQRAQHHGIGRVAFLARDGQILAAIANRLIARLRLSIEVIYLPASRQSTNLAATFDLKREETDWVFRDAPDLTLRQFLDRFDLSWEDSQSHFDNWTDPDVLLRADQMSTMRSLIDTPVIRQLVLERARARRGIVSKFLENHELIGSTPVGIVDFGGVGSQVRALHELLVDAGAAPPRIFLVGLDDPAQAGLRPPERDPAWLARTETWLYDHRRQRGYRRARGFGTCVQMFCAADHGTVTGYYEVDGKVMAKLAVDHDEPVLDWGLEILQQSVQRVVDELVLDEEVLDLAGDMRGISTYLVDMFWSDPELSEAAAWGSFPFEGAQATGDVPRRLAHRYTVPEIVRGMVDGTFPDLGWQHWYEGSLRLSPAPIRAGLEFGEFAFNSLRAAQGQLASGFVEWLRARRQ